MSPAAPPAPPWPAAVTLSETKALATACRPISSLFLPSAVHKNKLNVCVRLWGCNHFEINFPCEIYVHVIVGAAPNP